MITKKIAAAKSMLKYSDRPISEIAELLAFSSQSHFTKTFGAREGVTPKKYRDLNSFTADLEARK
ncbi:MAG: helix-turn-helix domain-containing protein [Oscillospiraceae bacterium]|nr:helix-turn-helix domain-containing protein [Oscillospiraceae bacterium]